MEWKIIVRPEVGLLFFKGGSTGAATPILLNVVALIATHGARLAPSIGRKDDPGAKVSPSTVIVPLIVMPLSPQGPV